MQAGLYEQLHSPDHDGESSCRCDGSGGPKLPPDSLAASASVIIGMSSGNRAEDLAQHLVIAG